MSEGININKSLSNLGGVIQDLNDKKKMINYRGSKLTMILKDSLGGNSRTTMLACVSPAKDNFLPTKSTLLYAKKARNI